MASLFQFSVRSLLVAVTIVALGIAALLNAGPWWEAFAWGAVLFIFSCTLLLIVYRREQTRAYWLGFTVFGGMYLALLLYSFTAEWKNNPYSNNPLHYNSLATTKLTLLIYESLLPESRRQDFIPAPPQVAGSGGPTSITAYAVDALTMGSGGAASEPGATSAPGSPPVAVDVTGTTAAYGSSDGSGPVALSFGVIGPIPGLSPPTIPNPSYIPPGSFISIGQALWLLLIAAVGGKVCQLIYRTKPAAQV